MTQLRLGDIVLDVVKKDIKNVHLSVLPPSGKVRIAAPLTMKTDTIRVYAISKLGWIKRQQQKMRDQEREPEREYVERESHYVWGKRYLLKVVEVDHAPSADLKPTRLVLRIRSGADHAARQSAMDDWYRSQLKTAVDPLIDKWQARLGVRISRYFVQRMKTKWGGCTPTRRTIRLNTELAKKPPQCLEYIVVHELMHLLEPHHNDRFIALMDRHMPLWRAHRDTLNRTPLGHEEWMY